MTPEENVVSGALAIVLQVMALYGAKKLRGTTLILPCLWVATAASCLLFLAVAQFQGAEGLTISVLRFAVAAITLCPVIAVLGAKRPQDRGWQWVVAALWLILVWPAAQALASPVGPEFEIFLPWKMFIVALIAMGPLNYLPTRYWLAAMFVAGAQWLLFSKYLGVEQPDVWLPAATLCLVIAAFLIVMRHKDNAASAEVVDQSQRWIWFRDAYGAFWGLRIMQRINETATLRKWPVQLTWAGFERVNDEAVTAAHLAEIGQTLDTLLRRFL